MKYIINKKLFRISFWLILTLIAYTILIEGTGILKETAILKCPYETGKPCIFKYENGSTLTLQAGETYNYNSHKQQNINLANYGSLTILIIIILLNHLIYNKEYTWKDFKNNLTEDKIIEKIKKETIYHLYYPIKIIEWIIKKINSR